MSPACTQVLALTCHPQTRTEAVHRIEVRVGRMPGGVLNLTYMLTANLAHLRVPDARAPAAADRLWQHTCFEAFVRVGAPAYHEFNFSPSREWAQYAFEGYRQRAPLDISALDPKLTVRRTSERLELDARIDLHRLSPAHARATLNIGLAAVIEDGEGALSYWALAHPAGRPDFHDPRGFALELADV